MTQSPQVPIGEVPVENEPDDKFVVRPAGGNGGFQVHGNRSARM